MSAEVVPLPHPDNRSAAQPDSARLAESARAAFTGMNLHIGASRVVHTVNWAEWIDGHDLPVPACRQGFAGTGTHGELTPTRWPVTCRRCRRLHGDDEHQEQPALFAMPGPDER